MNYTALASEESIRAATAGLEEHHVTPFIAATGQEALAKIKELIPTGASVMNGASRTLEEIGFVDYLKGGQHGWNNLHEAILAEKDPVVQQRLRRESVLSDFYLGSVHALSETGDMVIASNTGSQLPHIVFTSPNLILVVSTRKIVPTLADAFNRLYEHVIPLEDEHMKQKYGMGTAPNKVLVFHGENERMGRKVWVILVKEALGF